MRQEIEVNISEIKVPKHYIEPKADKYKSYKKEYEETGKLRPIKVNTELEIIDGYISYLIMNKINNPENKIKVYQYTTKEKSQEKDLYIYGRHPHSKDLKEYVWRAGKKLIEFKDIEIGGYFTAYTKNGCSLVQVTRYEVLDNSPTEKGIKTVIKYIGKELKNKDDSIRISE